ncbi:MAG: type III polyketide synthase, partial [Candidatus Dormibacteraeota bacterium]|nr:type III polyketide synthase [Candidatus Dormibacteraeota bacterium]
MGSRVLAIGTALPEHVLDATARHETLKAIWPRMALLGNAVDDTGGNRYLALPAARLLEPRGLTETMTLYARHGGHLAEEACRQALDRAGAKAEEIDLIISVSCTGYLVPSLDVHLSERLGLRQDVVRMPLTELGCSGGAAALALGHRHLAAYPEQRVLIVAVELTSLTFQPKDTSLDNLTASMVFGDGAAAAVMAGPATGSAAGLAVEAAASHLVAGTVSALGYDLRDDGFHVVLDRRLPRVIGRSIGAVAGAFLERVGMERVEFLAAHGGGPRVLDSVQAALDLDDELLAASRRTYAEIGNVSSASILFTLAALLPCFGSRPLQGLG